MIGALQPIVTKVTLDTLSLNEPKTLAAAA